MCKYCKNLKRIRDLEEKEYLEIIKAWRRECLKGRKLVEKLYAQLLYGGSSVLFISNEVEVFLNKDWIRR